MTRLLAILTFTIAAFIGSAGLSNAEPCMMSLGNGQLAPCPPPIVSTGPGDPAPPGHPAEDPAPEVTHEYKTPEWLLESEPPADA
ncbi:hypothetical protein [Gordonia sp. 'Campus']|uniref:hypothetical protein n=1 Tax=Gordonia sp. 'Campus' TaxID=2915824 RepID=UPI001EE42B89|nr:hypothetical protein [Gordonia sp. 'Campus']